MAKLKRVVIKEELIALLGDALSALILNQILYWSERVRGFDAFIDEERSRGGDPNVELTNGWIYKSSAELGEEIMMGTSDSTIRRRLDDLVEAGYIDRRESPHKWDRTLQYRPNIYKIQHDLAGLGYVLDGYPIQFQFEMVEIGDDGRAASIAQDEGSSVQSEGSSVQGEASIVRSVETVPEITTETRPEIMSRNNNTPATASSGDAQGVAQSENDPVAVAALALSARANEAIEALRDLGLVPERLAREYGLADPAAALGWVSYARREGLGAAYVRKRLEAGDEPPPPKLRRAAPLRAVRVFR